MEDARKKYRLEQVWEEAGSMYTIINKPQKC